MPQYFHHGRDSYYEDDRKPRYGLLALTLLLSLIAHYLLLVSVSDMRFDIMANIDPALRRPHEQSPSTVNRIAQDPQAPLDNPIFGDPTEAPSVGIETAVEKLASPPDVALSVPPVSAQTLQAVDFAAPDAPDLTPPETVWLPRQEVLMVVNKLVRDEVALKPRLQVPDIQRINRAPDYTPPVDIKRIRFAEDASPKLPVPLRNVGLEEMKANAKPTRMEPVIAEPVESQKTETLISKFSEKPTDISEFKAVDSRLMARTTVFRTADRKRTFFRVEVAARDPNVLPIVPKDIMFVQDASRSLAYERLGFCIKGMTQAIRQLNPGDRFNVVSFRENASYCFPDWVSPNDSNIKTATTFIESLRSEGETDVFASMRSLLEVARDSARPLIIILVTDGKATIGLTETTRIIGEFSRLNDNVSVFAVGTHGRANNYLLDILTYCNRGASSVVTSGRWDIPDHIVEIARNAANPVLGRVAVLSSVESKAELFPLPSANLYADRTLEYYGACPGDVNELVLQVRGEGGKAKCDVFFQIDLNEAVKGGEDIRSGWAKRKMHSLIGAYARTPSAALLTEMYRLSNEENIAIPYRDKIQ